jgi:hypothetical protein
MDSKRMRERRDVPSSLCRLGKTRARPRLQVFATFAVLVACASTNGSNGWLDSCSSRDGAIMHGASVSAEVMAARPSDFVMDIDGAGVATIQRVVVAPDRTVRVDYAYEATDGSGESRQGSLTLTGGSGQVTGRFRTQASNGHVYEGAVELAFAGSGAAGTYEFGGRMYGLRIRHL